MVFLDFDPAKPEGLALGNAADPTSPTSQKCGRRFLRDDIEKHNITVALDLLIERSHKLQAFVPRSTGGKTASTTKTKREEKGE